MYNVVPMSYIIEHNCTTYQIQIHLARTRIILHDRTNMNYILLLILDICFGLVKIFFQSINYIVATYQGIYYYLSNCDCNTQTTI